MSRKVLLMIGGGWHPFESCGKILSDYLTKDAGYEVVTTSDRGMFRKLDEFDAVGVQNLHRVGVESMGGDIVDRLGGIFDCGKGCDGRAVVFGQGV